MRNYQKENYEFTKKELLVSALGYSETYRKRVVNQMVEDILKCLVEQRILKYSIDYKVEIIDGREVAIPVMVLEHLATRFEDIGKG